MDFDPLRNAVDQVELVAYLDHGELPDDPVRTARVRQRGAVELIEIMRNARARERAYLNGPAAAWDTAPSPFDEFQEWLRARPWLAGRDL